MDSHNIDLETSLIKDLNDEQTTVFRECIHGDSSVFCTGGGGTGKSRVVTSVIKYLRDCHIDTPQQVAVTAPTGVAAFLIRGMTLHRFAGVGIIEGDKEEMLRRASTGKSLHYWKNSNVIIIDEVSMVSSQFFDNLSYVAMSIRGSSEAFGGIRILMFGDFLQLPPISRRGTFVSYAFESAAWKDLNPSVFVLTRPMRQQDIEFTTMLSKIRIGDCTDEVCEYFDSLSRDIEYDDGIDAVRLYSLRATTDQYNQSKLDSTSFSVRTYESIDKGDRNSLSQCPAPKNLHLKMGCQVMLTRNLSSVAVNGSIGTVIGFRYVSEMGSFQPLVKFVGANNHKFTLSVPRCTWDTVAPNGELISSRSQIPLILAWAITIHKSQGQSIPRLYIDLEGTFESGQAYVGLSRCTDPSTLQVVGFKRELVKVNRECLQYYRKLSEPVATDVAHPTPQTWGSHTADTLFMLGHLSVQETSQSSSQDSETS